VYDFSHLGHARTYIVFDMVVKYLRAKGYQVFYLQNITDIDDKIIQRARELQTPWHRLAHQFEQQYLQDMKLLGINSVSQYARATHHMKEILSQVRRLLKKKYAYKSQDGIYYDIAKFHDYGKLSGRTTHQAEDAVSRIDDSTEKKNKGDFCLWKLSKPDEPKWKSPWGDGRPGWHIEDTAITEKYFGPQYDIHGGAHDLIFPHHEAEIAQMEAISEKKPLVRYWMHTGFLTVRGEKMAKSLNNFITIRDFLKHYSPRVLRLFILKSHYRSPIDYSEKAIKQTQKELERIDEFVERLSSQKSNAKTPHRILKRINTIKRNFYSAMDDDCNTPKAIAAIFDLVNYGNKLGDQRKLNKQHVESIVQFLKEADKFLQFIFWGTEKKKIIPAEVLKLVSEREQYRKQKNWQKADELRIRIQRMGYRIEDTSEGPKIKPQ
jgi:cysteinyl-tRNA synthetase